MNLTTAKWITVPILCVIAASASAFEAEVAELWVQSGELRFVLEDCGPQYFRLGANDADTSHAFDMLLSALLSHRKVRVYDSNFNAVVGCPTRNTLVGSVRIERDTFD